MEPPCSPEAMGPSTSQSVASDPIQGPSQAILELSPNFIEHFVQSPVEESDTERLFYVPDFAEMTSGQISFTESALRSQPSLSENDDHSGTEPKSRPRAMSSSSCPSTCGLCIADQAKDQNQLIDTTNRLNLRATPYSRRVETSLSNSPSLRDMGFEQRFVGHPVFHSNPEILLPVYQTGNSRTDGSSGSTFSPEFVANFHRRYCNEAKAPQNPQPPQHLAPPGPRPAYPMVARKGNERPQNFYMERLAIGGFVTEHLVDDQQQFVAMFKVIFTKERLIYEFPFPVEGQEIRQGSQTKSKPRSFLRFALIVPFSTITALNIYDREVLLTVNRVPQLLYSDPKSGERVAFNASPVDPSKGNIKIYSLHQLLIKRNQTNRLKSCLLSHDPRFLALMRVNIVPNPLQYRYNLPELDSEERKVYIHVETSPDSLLKTSIGPNSNGINC